LKSSADTSKCHDETAKSTKRSGRGITARVLDGITARVLNGTTAMEDIVGNGAIVRTCHDATPSTTFKIVVRDTDALIFHGHGILVNEHRYEIDEHRKALNVGETNPSIGSQATICVRGACILGGRSGAPETSGQEES
jgi:hypothetical protein